MHQNRYTTQFEHAESNESVCGDQKPDFDYEKPDLSYENHPSRFWFPLLPQRWILPISDILFRSIALREYRNVILVSWKRDIGELVANKTHIRREIFIIKHITKNFFVLAATLK